MADGKVTILKNELLHKGYHELLKVDAAVSRPGQEDRHLSREIFVIGPVVAILPYDAARGTILLVRQPRIPVLLAGEDPFHLEVCAGKADPDEPPEDAVVRETEEELGYRPRNIRQITSAYPACGNVLEKMTLFLAEYSGADRIEGAGGGLEAEGESIEIVEMPLEDALRMMDRGEINDLKTLFLLMALERELRA